MAMDSGIGEALSNLPIGQLIKNVALGIAEGQTAVDVESIRTAQMMSGYGPNKIDGEKMQMEDYRVAFGRDANGKPELVSMMELGFTPVFYQFIDTLIEVKMAITVTRNNDNVVKNKGTETSVSANSNRYFGWFRSSSVTVRSTPVDATYASKYSYTAEGSSLVRTKMVPVPPPAILEERIRAVIAEESIRTGPNKAKPAGTTNLLSGSN
ncbi:hypothetical protein [Granulosicoccus antarcticus]|uniref:Uncharacterized protein n=1 Tax=Granulosicoccus antarcticus IMCC3135 TaxID=1192854 RepID=A0A2Z2NQM6_9GAMM|nr:hypothetical protein [Granulosicoccus antarcticus]ASJ71978.1 hypothetical protein IMCC3135_09405 [Granulosicoccus antarcticus IMCC3135]